MLFPGRFQIQWIEVKPELCACVEKQLIKCHRPTWNQINNDYPGRTPACDQWRVGSIACQVLYADDDQYQTFARKRHNGEDFGAFPKPDRSLTDMHRTFHENRN
jgi:hypothetical protein